MVPRLKGESFNKGRLSNAEIPFHRGTDHRRSGRAGARVNHRRDLPQTRVSPATFYKWKARFGGLDVSDARKLKGLEDENRRLKKLLAESMLGSSAHWDAAPWASADVIQSHVCGLAAASPPGAPRDRAGRASCGSSSCLRVPGARRCGDRRPRIFL